MVIGVDEAGRGCWAGPLVAAAVMLHEPIKGLEDSKALSEARRLACAEQISENGMGALGWVSASEIDRLGMTKAVRLAMRRAVNGLLKEVNGYQQIIVDGPFNFLSELPRTSAIIRADSLVPCVSAAGIMAKVNRDTYMRRLATRFPAYGFEKHVGYGTSLHRQMLEVHGPTPYHRRSFKPIIQITSNLT